VPLPVLASEPCVKLVESAATWTPVPICTEVPPERSVLLKVSAKLAALLLYPVVLTLAMLLPMTSRPLLKVLRVLTPEVSVPMSAMVVE